MPALPVRGKSVWLFSVCLLVAEGVHGQELVMKPPTIPYIYFPYPVEAGHTNRSLGIAFTTSPRDITEELQVAVPAGDLQLLRGVSSRVALTGRLTFQGIQNQLALGVRYYKPLGAHVSLSIGNDVGGWFGFIKSDQFNDRGSGLLTYPNLTVGFRGTDDLLYSLKAEGIFSLYYHSNVGKVTTQSGRIRADGIGLTFAIEQPFYGKRHLTLGFRALYSNFNWQFWSLYETFDRNIFYPEVVIGFFL